MGGYLNKISAESILRRAEGGISVKKALRYSPPAFRLAGLCFPALLTAARLWKVRA